MGFWFGGSRRPAVPAWAAELRNRRFQDRSKDNPGVHCLPLGILQMDTHRFPRRFIPAPAYLAILGERDTEYPQIFTDGWLLPTDPQPAWNGYSTGKRVGDTLVAETIGFRDGVWADYSGSRLTSAAKITERFRRPTFRSMEIEIAVDASKAYTKPWTVKLTSPSSSTRTA